MPSPRTQAIYDYVTGSEYRRQLARRIADEIVRQNADVLWSSGGEDLAEMLVKNLTVQIRELIDQSLVESLDHLVTMGYNPMEVDTVLGWIPQLAEANASAIAKRAESVLANAILEAQHNVASMPAAVASGLPQASMDAVLSSVRSTLRQTAAGLVANAERTAMDYAIVEHASGFARPFAALSAEKLDEVWAAYKAGRNFSLDVPTMYGGNVPAQIEIRPQAQSAGQLYHGELNRPTESITAGATAASGDRIIIQSGMNRAAFEGVLQHEYAHAKSLNMGINPFDESRREYESGRNIHPWSGGDLPSAEGPLFAWETRLDNRVCFDQFENSCEPRHGWQLSESEWDFIGRPQAQNLICSIYAKGATSMCRCMLLPGDVHDEMPINISEASNEGRRAADAEMLG